ncbi:hypothetical protein MCA1342 [Methylococcus capsulatus str. Bath]|uniref:Uncharacterized protein n=1 Tax=Methylococcus capsulatus (strain ATCC 33009 / NCIMB 11132 / Bath) TaxID=243233 RepID=Q608Z3_METCA|nr:hypothetical protein MCA1342 [Methylococcus capsulatus str. Bath]
MRSKSAGRLRDAVESLGWDASRQDSRRGRKVTKWWF